MLYSNSVLLKSFVFVFGDQPVKGHRILSISGPGESLTLSVPSERETIGKQEASSRDILYIDTLVLLITRFNPDSSGAASADKRTHGVLELLIPPLDLYS